MKNERRFKVSLCTMSLLLVLGTLIVCNNAAAAEKVYTIRLAEFYAAPPGGGRVHGRGPLERGDGRAK